VYLKAITMRGFKSFPERVEVRLEPGVAVVVGPNGSGKSNVADALVWASGSLAPSELRAEKPDDVLFAGAAAGREGLPPARSCEVELLFDNADGAIPGLDFSEVSIVRRLHRGGEGQYLVNGAQVRRLDIVELLADVGLGPGTGSIVSQGKVEAILASSPSERRTLVEEAAGLGRFKRRRHRAELKLARVAQQVERARDLEAEVQKRLRPLALQASAAERAEKLAVEIAQVRAGIASLDLAELGKRLGEAELRRERASADRRHVEERLEAALRDREHAEEALAAVAGGREGAAASVYRMRSTRERLGLRREAVDELAGRLRQPVVVKGGEDLRERARIAEARAASLERALAEREGLPPAARSLSERGEQLALSLVHVEQGSERAVAAALRWRASALVADDADQALALLELARAEGLGSLTVLVRPDLGELVRTLPVVPLGELLSSRVPAVTREGFGYDPERGELWFAGETAEAVLLELEAQARRVRAEARQLADQAAAARPYVREPDDRLVSLAVRLSAALVASAAAAERIERPLVAEAESGSERVAELAAELRRLGGVEAELRREASGAGERAGAIEVELARLEAEAAEARRRLAEAGAEAAEGTRDELEPRLERLERRREALGSVNPFAKEEYAREKEHLEELREQRADLERSLAELETLRRDLAETVEQRFTETFAAVERNFAEVASTLFPAGEGRLRLTEPDAEGATEDAHDPGIEVELRPAGKRITRLSLLSGGEKALGAISFLFALFLARPCAFYLLDEVEAALDDTNIGRFVELLRRFADRAQFIVITHQKRTMEAADILYGVTMGPDGISQVVSRRLPREDAAALSA
jgi:chromosome segregation protein